MSETFEEQIKKHASSYAQLQLLCTMADLRGELDKKEWVRVEDAAAVHRLETKNLIETVQKLNFKIKYQEENMIPRDKLYAKLRRLAKPRAGSLFLSDQENAIKFVLKEMLELDNSVELEKAKQIKQAFIEDVKRKEKLAELLKTRPKYSDFSRIDNPLTVALECEKHFKKLEGLLKQ